MIELAGTRISQPGVSRHRVNDRRPSVLQDRDEIRRRMRGKRRGLPTLARTERAPHTTREREHSVFRERDRSQTKTSEVLRLHVRASTVRPAHIHRTVEDHRKAFPPAPTRNLSPPTSCKMASTVGRLQYGGDPHPPFLYQYHSPPPSNHQSVPDKTCAVTVVSRPTTQTNNHTPRKGAHAPLPTGRGSGLRAPWAIPTVWTDGQVQY